MTHYFDAYTANTIEGWNQTPHRNVGGLDGLNSIRRADPQCRLFPGGILAPEAAALAGQ